MPCFGLVVFMYCIPPTTPAADVARFCAVAKPIRLSHKDTRGTKEQADRFNRIGARLCGWGA